MIRSGIYTIVDDFHFEVNTIRDDDEHFLLTFRGKSIPFSFFRKSKFEDDAFESVVKKGEVLNAYYVQTFAIYKDATFQVFPVTYDKRLIRLATSNNIYEGKLNFVKVGENWYLKDIPIHEAEKIWEERTSVLNLPFPLNLEKIQYYSTYNL